MVVLKGVLYAMNIQNDSLILYGEKYRHCAKINCVCYRR